MDDSLASFKALSAASELFSLLSPSPNRDRDISNPRLSKHGLNGWMDGLNGLHVGWMDGWMDGLH
jgi:hypothetical protein